MKATDKRIKYTEDGRPYIEYPRKNSKYIMRQYGKIIKCKNCGESGFVNDRQIKNGQGDFCTIKCSVTGEFSSNYEKRGENHPAWKGGRRKHSAGYMLIYNPNHLYADNKGCVREHRLVMEKYLGRYLTKDEIVHHLNGIKSDNRIENLCITTPKNHDTQSYVKMLQSEIKRLQDTKITEVIDYTLYYIGMDCFDKTHLYENAIKRLERK